MQQCSQWSLPSAQYRVESGHRAQWPGLRSQVECKHCLTQTLSRRELAPTTDDRKCIVRNHFNIETAMKITKRW